MFSSTNRRLLFRVQSGCDIRSSRLNTWPVSIRTPTLQSGTHVKNKIANFMKKFFENELQKLTQTEIARSFSSLLKITVKDVLEFYDILLPGETLEMRKLTIQVVGRVDREFSQEFI